MILHNNQQVKVIKKIHIIIIKMGILLFFTLFNHAIYASQIKDINNLVGDNINVEIYKFLGDAILESDKQQKSHSELEQIRHEEINIHRNQLRDLKPLKANISEGEISKLLNLLCSSNSKCYNITLYNIQGLGIASSPMDKDFEQKIIKNRNEQFYIKILDKDLMKNFKRTFNKLCHS